MELMTQRTARPLQPPTSRARKRLTIAAAVSAIEVAAPELSWPKRRTRRRLKRSALGQASGERFRGRT
jgi:hypothetical protein